jgi:hypothetical protein
MSDHQLLSRGETLDLYDRISNPHATHGELSSFLLALYGNWTIMGNTDQNLLFYQDGVESTYAGMTATVMQLKNPGF